MTKTRKHQHSLPVDPIVLRQTMAREIGVSKTTLWRMTKAGELPKPVRIGNKLGWPRSVVNAWKIKQGWPAEGDAA